MAIAGNVDFASLSVSGVHFVTMEGSVTGVRVRDDGAASLARNFLSGKRASEKPGAVQCLVRVHVYAHISLTLSSSFSRRALTKCE